MATGKYFTLGQASKETGIHKSTLSKALKSGKISYIEKSSSGYKIDPAELFRVYPQKPLSPVDSRRLDTPTNQQDNSALEAENKRLKEQVSELRDERDEWRKQAQQLALAPPKKNGLETDGLNKPFWRRLFRVE